MPSQQDPKSAQCVPDPFLLLGVGSGHETTIAYPSRSCQEAVPMGIATGVPVIKLHADATYLVYTLKKDAIGLLTAFLR